MFSIMQIPELILLQLSSRTLLQINKLPHYHGAQWSALFRNVFNRYLPPDMDMAKAGIWIHPIETGITSYQKDEVVHLGLTFPAQHKGIIKQALDAFNSFNTDQGHFQPGRTIALEHVRCRISRDTWNAENSLHLCHDTIQSEADKLTSLSRFSILFLSPLRLNRPEGLKTEGHKFCDEEFFLGSLPENISPLTHLINSIRTKKDTTDTQNLKITRGALVWLDIAYGDIIKKTIGGAAGRLTVEGSPSKEAAQLLAAGQYLGVGKNPAFGLGFYNIPELDSARKIAPFSRGVSLLQRAMAVNRLQSALDRLPKSSPGPDMLTVKDLKKAGQTWIKSLADSVIDNTYIQGGVKKYSMPKPDGSFRTIYSQNTTDKLLQRAAADHLTPAIDVFLSDCSYAYRRGLNRKGAASALKKAMSEGCTTGVKADISAFFDSVSIDTMACLLEGLFPLEPLVQRIIGWLTELQKHGVKGLPQGSPLSPLLSNLYLNRFDRDMEKEGFRLIRFADDFVVLFSPDQSKEAGIKQVEASLARLGLHLKMEKTTDISQNEPVKFLGYLVTASEVIEPDKENKQEQETWDSVFKEQWLQGCPVYLTCVCLGASSKGPYLKVKTSTSQEEQIPWNSISRIVVVGRSYFSGGVVYRAVKEQVPVTFIDIMGQARGHLYPESYDLPELCPFQERLAKDEEFCFSFAKEVITAKLKNSFVLLRRNSIKSTELRDIIGKLNTAKDIAALRGYEGIGAKIYFSEFAKLVEPFEFKGRIYHPPDGPVNAMLSFGYTLLYNRIAAVLKDKGFNPRIGFFHAGRGRHAALASDLLEELRHVVERIVLAMIHLKEIKPDDFVIVKRKEISTCRLQGEAFRKYIHRYETTMAKEFSLRREKKISTNPLCQDSCRILKMIF